MILIKGMIKIKQLLDLEVNGMCNCLTLQEKEITNSVKNV